MNRRVVSLSLIILATICVNIDSGPFFQQVTGAKALQKPAIVPTPDPLDMSGKFTGALDFPDARFSGRATLIIKKDKFTLVGRGLNLHGTVKVTESGADRVVNLLMIIEEGSTAAGAPFKGTLSLEAGVIDDDFKIRTRPDDTQKFNFLVTPLGGGSPSTNTATNANIPTTRLPPIGAMPEAPVVRSKRPRANARATAPVDNAVTTDSGNDAGSAPNANSNVKADPSLYDQLKGDANAVFTTPSEMRFEETTVIELLVSPTKSTEQLQSELTEKGESGQAATQYSKMMEGQLVGQGFNITQVGPSIQPVEPGRTTRWKWQIKPKEGGAQRLDLTLNAVLNDGKDRILLQTLHREIKVNVKFSQRAAGWFGSMKDMYWLWGAIILPVATFMIAWWRRRKGKTSEGEKT